MVLFIKRIQVKHYCYYIISHNALHNPIMHCKPSRWHKSFHQKSIEDDEQTSAHQHPITIAELKCSGWKNLKMLRGEGTGDKIRNYLRVIADKSGSISFVFGSSFIGSQNSFSITSTSCWLKLCHPCTGTRYCQWYGHGQWWLLQRRPSAHSPLKKSRQIWADELTLKLTAQRNDKLIIKIRV